MDEMSIAFHRARYYDRDSCHGSQRQTPVGPTLFWISNALPNSYDTERPARGVNRRLGKLQSDEISPYSGSGNLGAKAGWSAGRGGLWCKACISV